MHIPKVDEQEKRFSVRDGANPVNRGVVQLLLCHRGIKQVPQTRVDDVLITTPKPDPLPEKSVHRACGVTVFQKNLGQKGGTSRKSSFATVRDHAVTQRMQARKDRGMRRLRRYAGGEHIFTKRALAGQPIDMRAGSKRILV